MRCVCIHLFQSHSGQWVLLIYAAAGQGARMNSIAEDRAEEGGESK